MDKPYFLAARQLLLESAREMGCAIGLPPERCCRSKSRAWLTAPVSYTGGTAYFALKSQNAEGNWSDLSNNAFWSRFDVYLPPVMRAYGL